MWLYGSATISPRLTSNGTLHLGFAQSCPRQTSFTYACLLQRPVIYPSLTGQPFIHLHHERTGSTTSRRATPRRTSSRRHTDSSGTQRRTANTRTDTTDSATTGRGSRKARHLGSRIRPTTQAASYGAATGANAGAAASTATAGTADPTRPAKARSTRGRKLAEDAGAEAEDSCSR